ncbi:DUF2913 family protein (plasmid) [Vibrio cholerae]|uniref:DUF2913 family protein n=1 Tax=Vibrio cholerae TaxID=666 RepID=UPI001183708A|nr:DUF2913 family protein [Vibrio cholerae]EJL6460801.1 DUF2913 family protein [Vibrio cholerae]MBJ6954137.1 DUF2913 family protein [Vibrio cholerae]MVC22252.1 DUF2913 family protein [Vibrio cholerae]QKU73145.1 DUF2913 family protein [Vibrio cholerae]QKU77135.1 DUF2913 family protein [Vibrio cholerae]
MSKVLHVQQSLYNREKPNQKDDIMSFTLRHDNPAKLAHVAWCALVALGIARKYPNPPKNRVAANKFIGHWAIQAAKSGRFGNAFKDELDIWASNGIKNGMLSNMEKSLETVIETYQKKAEQAKRFPGSYKRRINNAGDKLKDAGWEITWGLDRDWETEGTYEATADNTAFIMREHFESFDNLGRLTAPITLLVISNNVQQLVDEFYDSGIVLFLHQKNRHKGRTQYAIEIWPDNNGNPEKHMPQTDA